NNDTGKDELLNSYFDTYKELKDMNQNREFRLKTPWKYNVSLGYTVGQNLAIGAEYEYEDYSSVKFRYPEGDKMEFETNAAKMVMKGVNTFRIGAEYKVIPQF
ncbi:putative hemin receptor domain protein, partial [Bacteroides fragilis str. 3783N2-1]